MGYSLGAFKVQVLQFAAHIAEGNYDTSPPATADLAQALLADPGDLNAFCSDVSNFLPSTHPLVVVTDPKLNEWLNLEAEIVVIAATITLPATHQATPDAANAILQHTHFYAVTQQGIRYAGRITP